MPSETSPAKGHRKDADDDQEVGGIEGVQG